MMIELVLEDIPEGFEEMPVQAVYRKGKLLVLLGVPVDGRHNCDEMGCGSVGPHVLAYAEIVKEDMDATQ